MNCREMMSGFAMAGAFLAGACTALPPGTAQRTCEVLVAKAVDYFAANGAEAIIVAVNAGNGFHQSELYVFMIGPDETNVANAADQTNVGKDARLLKDFDGKFYGVELIERATAEGVGRLQTDESRERQNRAQDELGQGNRWLRDWLRLLQGRIGDALLFLQVFSRMPRISF